MKKIVKVLTILSIAMSSNHLFAIEGYGYKIISESNVTVGKNSKGYIERKDIGHLNVQYTDVSVATDDIGGDVGKIKKMSGRHFFKVINNTGHKQRYKVRYYIDCLSASNIHDIELELDPSGLSYDNANNYLAVQPTSKGKFPITAYTEIIGDEYKKAIDNKFLYVNK